MSLATKRVICWIRGHTMGRWRRYTVPIGALGAFHSMRKRVCTRCGGNIETEAAPAPRKRAATPGDTVMP